MNRVYCATSGEVVEWPKALVLKTRDGKLSVGSNPTLSANFFYSDPNYLFLLRPQLFISTLSANYFYSDPNYLNFTPTPIIRGSVYSYKHLLYSIN